MCIRDRPITLNIITIPLTKKIEFLLLREIKPSKFVILDFCSFLTEILFVGAKFKRVGSRVNVMKNDVIKPKVIIHPKSIIGLISLKIKDKKAKIVVKTVYKIGQNILLVVKEMISRLFFDGNFFLSWRNLVLI